MIAIVTTRKRSSHKNHGLIKDVRAHCYCASLVRTLFIGHARATSFSSARIELKTQQNIELMTFALTWCANIFVGRSAISFPQPTCLLVSTNGADQKARGLWERDWTLGDPHFFFGRSFPFLTLSIILKNKKICAWEVSIISHILFKKGRIGTWIQVCVT